MCKFVEEKKTVVSIFGSESDSFAVLPTSCSHNRLNSDQEVPLIVPG